MAFDIVVFNDGAAWGYKRQDILDKVGAALPDDQIRDAIRSRFSATVDVVAVGTASQEGAPEEEERRALDRAEKLLKTFADIVPPKARRWTLNFGQSKTLCANCTIAETASQRPVVIIGVVTKEASANFDEALRSALSQVPETPRPENYSRFDLVPKR